MKSALTGLVTLTAILLGPSVANAAMEFRCNWEGRPVAITVDSDAGDLLYSQHYAGTGYYAISVTRTGVWLLLDEPKPVLSIKLVRPDEGQRIGLPVKDSLEGARCYKGTSQKRPLVDLTKLNP